MELAYIVTGFVRKLLGCRYMFCGHYHGNCGGFYKDMEQVVTTAVGAPLHNDPSGFRVVNVHEDRISHEFVPFFENLEDQKGNNYMPRQPSL